jgi:hypothetical protein
MTHTDGEPTSLDVRLDALKRELDALQIQVMSERAPWYKQVPVIVSLLVSVAALGFSFWTAKKGEDRLDRQEEHEARAELRNLVQRLQTLPREDLQLAITFRDDANARNQVAASILVERQVIARQAADLIDELGGDVSAPEYYSVVGGLLESGQPSEVDALIRRGLEVATDPQSAATLHRWAARMHFDAGDKVAGRAAYKQALSVFQRFPHPDPAWINVIQGQTRVLWAADEARKRECKEAWRQVSLAQRIPSYAQSASSTARFVESLCGAKPS